MATETSNLHLKKPGTGDTASITDINNNMDILDSALVIDNKNATLSFGTSKTLATIGNKPITANMPSAPANTWRGFTTRFFSVSYSNLYSRGVFTANFSLSVSGYTPVAFIKIDSGNTSAVFTYFGIDGNGAAVRILNTYSGAISGAITITVLYLQN